MAHAIEAEALPDVQSPPEHRTAPSLEQVLAEIDALAPVVKDSGAKAEVTRRVPREVERRLRDAGLYRLSLPRSHGGLELDLPSLMKVTQELSRLDGSIG